MPRDTAMAPLPLRHQRKHYSYSTLHDKSPREVINQVEIELQSAEKSNANNSTKSLEFQNDSKSAKESTPTGLFSRIRGWRLGAFLSAVTALASLVVNTAVAIWLLGKGSREALVEVFRGNCSTAAKTDVLIHLAINILSTVLLSGSNYCMQCLVAPSRAEVDKAHSKGTYLDIAVPSVRNLRLISKYKVFLWLVLALSSVPLHLMYNSVFFKSLNTNAYDVLLVTEDFMQGDPTDNAFFKGRAPIAQMGDTFEYKADDLRRRVNATAAQANLTSYDQLDLTECINAYAVDFQTKRRNLIMVIDGDTNEFVTRLDSKGIEHIVANYTVRTDDPLLDQQGLYYPRQVVCQTAGGVVTCSARGGKTEPGDEKWRPYGQQIASCYSEPIEEMCTYSANLPILAVVIVCNLFKALSMFFVACHLGGRPLLTVGDALASFLKHPDPTTKGFCLLSRNRVQSRIWPGDLGEDREPMPPVPSQRWFWASSTKRRYCVITLLVICLTATIIFIGIALYSLRGSNLSIAAIGLGKLQTANIIVTTFLGKGSATAQIMAAVFTANAPQAILSFLYLNLNAFLTVMWLASEFADYARERKPLRCSQPKGRQRGTHFLQLPYKIALPLVAFSALLHWLVSQSIFLAVVAEYDPRGDLYDSVAVASCAFSPLAMILGLLAVVLLFGATGGVAWFRRLDGGIPVAGSCSAAISAACHAPGWDRGLEEKEVMWGVPREGTGQTGEGQGWRGGKRRVPPHACFTSGEIDMVRQDLVYA